MVTIADWIIVAATVVTAGATLVLALITRRTLDESKASRELAARVALMPERLRLLRHVEELAASTIERPGVEEHVIDGLFDLEHQVEYLFGTESVWALTGLIGAIQKLKDSTQDRHTERGSGHWTTKTMSSEEAEDAVLSAHANFQRRARDTMSILPYRGSGIAGRTRHGWPDES
jgi:hypothetical protein